LRYALELEAHSSPLEPGSLARDLKGRLYHEALRGLYEHVFVNGNDGSVAEARRFLGRYFNSGLGGTYGLYPLVWKSLAAAMVERILKLWENDAASRGNFRPASFERAAEAASRCGFNVHGRIDRLDIDEAEKIVRVVDYKTSVKKRPSSAEKLLSSGKIFQPFFYLELANALFIKEGFRAREAVFLGLEDENGKDGAAPIQAFTAADAELSAEAVCSTAKLLASLAAEGRFFIRPDMGEQKRCDWCDYGSICRNRHGLSVARAADSASSTGLSEEEDDAVA